MLSQEMLDLYRAAKIRMDLYTMEEIREFPKWELKRERQQKEKMRQMYKTWSPAPAIEATDGSEVVVWDGLDWPRDEDGIPVPDGCATRFKGRNGQWIACWKCANGPHCPRQYNPSHTNIEFVWRHGRYEPASRWDERLGERMVRNGTSDAYVTGIPDEEIPMSPMEELQKFDELLSGLDETIPWSYKDHEWIVAKLTGISMSAGSEGMVPVPTTPRSDENNSEDDDDNYPEKSYAREARRGMVRTVYKGTRHFTRERCPDKLSNVWITRFGVKNADKPGNPLWKKVDTLGKDAWLTVRLTLNRYELNGHYTWLKHVCGKDNPKVRQQLLNYVSKVKHSVRPNGMCKAEFEEIKSELIGLAREAWKRSES